MSQCEVKVKDGEFEINRDAVEQYFRAAQTLLLFITLVWFFGLGIIVALVHYFAYSPWLCQLQAINLRYRLDGDTLRVDGGVFFLFRKSIPLERITDVALVQGPLLRHFGIWEMQIQTAGTGQGCEAKMYGVLDPEKVRELILSQRHKIYAEKSGDA